MSEMLTYILHDKKLGIYKIGQSTNIRQRLRQLCIPNEIVPIQIIKKNIEKKLHTEFESYRTTHPVKSAGGGYTEWFKYGGKFKPFIDELKPQNICFYTPHTLYEELIKSNKLRIDSVAAKMKLAMRDYYQYHIGRKILAALGYIYYSGIGYDSIHNNVEVEGPKIFLTDKLISDILNKYTIDIVSINSATVVSRLRRQFGRKLFVRTLDYLDDGTPIQILISELK